jgi:hypothetical protein
MDEAEMRCSNCGALVSAEADWCGQCYEPLRKPTARPVSAPAVDPHRPSAIERAGGDVTWRCPGCGRQNPIAEPACASCGTPFERLFREPARAPAIDPSVALMRSALLPGLGHWSLGRRADAVARFVLVAWLFGTATALLAARSGRALGPVSTLVALFVGSLAALWVTSAWDAHRIASGRDPLVTARTLLWGSVAVLMVSALVGTLVILPAARGG